MKGDAAEAKRQLEAAASKVEKPQDIWLEIGAIDDEMHLVLTLIVSFCLVFAILAAKFESLKIPFVVISVVPLALVCVVATLYGTEPSMLASRPSNVIFTSKECKDLCFLYLYSSQSPYGPNQN